MLSHTEGETKIWGLKNAAPSHGPTTPVGRRPRPFLALELRFSCFLRRWLDMEVSGDQVAVTVPLGIYPTMDAYCSALQEAGRDQHPTELKFFGVKFDPKQPFVRSTAVFTTLNRCPSESPPRRKRTES